MSWAFGWDDLFNRDIGKVTNGVRGEIEKVLSKKITDIPDEVIDNFFKEALRPGKDHGPIKKVEEQEDGWLYLEHEDGHGMFIGKEEFEAIKKLTAPDPQSTLSQNQ